MIKYLSHMQLKKTHKHIGPVVIWIFSNAKTTFLLHDLINPLIYGVCPVNSKYLWQPIPENSRLFKTFCCGCPYEKKSTN